MLSLFQLKRVAPMPGRFIVVSCALCLVTVAALISQYGRQKTHSPGATKARNVSLESAAESDSKNLSFPEFTQLVLLPTVHDVINIDWPLVDEVFERMRPDSRADASLLAHYLYLAGPEAVVAFSTTMQQSSIIDILLDSDRGAEHFGGLRALCKTRQGARFLNYERLRLGTEQRSSEAHDGQILSVLAAIGIPADRTIHLPGGSRSIVRDIVDDLQANFVLRDEIYWDTVALALYMPPTLVWRNRFGSQFDFNILAAHLLDSVDSPSPCAGTHRLIALTVLMRVDQLKPILSTEVRARVYEELSRTAEALTQAQQADGSWFPGAESVDLSRTAAWRQYPIADQVITTGHQLEWLMLLPAEIRPPDRVFVTASQYLISVVPDRTKDPKWLAEWYCPVTHALRSVKLLSHRRN